MMRALTRFLLCFALCGCQAWLAGKSDDSCPANIGCDEPSNDTRLIPGNAGRPKVVVAEYRPLWPGCPGSLQVMARLHPIVFQAARGDPESPATVDDPSDWVCEPPEPSLMRAGRAGAPTLAAR
jgi:hypothetical protein